MGKCVDATFFSPTSTALDSPTSTASVGGSSRPKSTRSSAWSFPKYVGPSRSTLDNPKVRWTFPKYIWTIRGLQSRSGGRPRGPVAVPKSEFALSRRLLKFESRTETAF
ncbi:hypothetical protein M885DRAFT_32773 [Pelagophyceae sp. CCMP2097]|nr:hypothetical protein M885DRAFT_32773 [Pelagophyceae sp. CCMP2097]